MKLTGKKEYRMFEVEMRAAVGANNDPIIEGYAAVFNKVYSHGDLKETVMPGAFTRALAEKQGVMCLFNHDDNVVLGSTANKTLTMAQDDKGLKFHCDVAPTQAARDVHALVQRGDIPGASFGFIVRKHELRHNADGSTSRAILDVDLLDVSPVTNPAYPDTSVEARSVNETSEFFKKANDAGCECRCAECRAENCEKCTDMECEDPECDHGERSRKLTADELATLRLKVEYRLGVKIETRSVMYLVSGKDGDHLPVTNNEGKPDHGLMGDAWAALHGGFRGNKYEGPDKAEAIAKLEKLYKSEGMDLPTS